ncbi:MAG: YciI family protein [bacterium]
MRFMVLMHPGDKTVEQGTMPDEKAIGEMMKYNEDLSKAGILLALDGLHPTSKGARVAFSDGKSTVTDGPFTETRELVGGYWLWQVKSKEEAVQWARRCPAGEGDMLELRQVFEMSDFGPAVEVQESARAAEIDKRNAENRAGGR